ncbi:MAG: J domain-containing protein [Natrialbaceae archaeon]|nr:J domain-containing protein [Natrialbaceae archaeon]
MTTIDGRIERLCDPCTATAREQGIVRSVAMSRSRAREVLEVSSGVSDEQLRTAFLEQIKRAHPDRSTGSESAFKLVKEAYDRLQ